ncbi:MAG: nicotinate phosphoribosyltransferase [bacterium]
MNPLLLIDGYKLDHRRQYPANTQRVYSNLTARGSRIAGQEDVVFLGLQYFLRRYLMDELTSFFAGDIEAIAARYTARVNGYLGPNAIGTDHIRALHALGYLPLEFRAVPEGTSVPLRVPLLTVENTHDDFAWLVNYYETLLSACLWMPTTSATSALRLRHLLESYARQTGSPLEFVPWQGHDFSFRGMAGVESAALSGMGHLVAFTGTDTIPAIDFIETYYGAPDGYLIGGSVAATEHSVMCAGGKSGELETFARLLDLYPSGIVSVVSDTWDLWHVLTNILPQLKERIMARDGKIVIRPDSGDPVKIVCGDPDASAGSPAHKGVVALLWELFGGATTSTGHRLLDAHIGCIYGDSISYERAAAILAGLDENGFASANMVFGVGSFTYQYVTRDTYNFAMKATWVQIDGEGIAIFKAPATDDGVKNSAKGRLAVLHDDTGHLTLINEATEEQEAASHLRLVWRNGAFVAFDSFDVIRDRALKPRAAVAP